MATVVLSIVRAWVSEGYPRAVTTNGVLLVIAVLAVGTLAVVLGRNGAGLIRAAWSKRSQVMRRWDLGMTCRNCRKSLPEGRYFCDDDCRYIATGSDR